MATTNAWARMMGARKSSAHPHGLYSPRFGVGLSELSDGTPRIAEDLSQVVLNVPDVVEGNVRQGHGFVFSDFAARVTVLLWYAGDHMG